MTLATVQSWVNLLFPAEYTKSTKVKINLTAASKRRVTFIWEGTTEAPGRRTEVTILTCGNQLYLLTSSSTVVPRTQHSSRKANPNSRLYGEKTRLFAVWQFRTKAKQAKWKPARSLSWPHFRPSSKYGSNKSVHWSTRSTEVLLGCFFIWPNSTLSQRSPKPLSFTR